VAEAHLEVYRRFEGTLEERRLRFWPILVAGLQTALKQKRTLRILYGPVAIATIIMSFAVYLGFEAQEQLDRARSEEQTLELGEAFAEQMAMAAAQSGMALLKVTSLLTNFIRFFGLLSVLAVAWLGCGLFCEDRKAGAHQLYFARPITRLDYFLGKFSIAACFALAAMLAPGLVLCVVASVSSPEWSFLTEEWDVVLRVIAYSCTWTLILVSLVLLASSLASRRSFALIGIIGFFAISEVMGNALGALVGPGFFAISMIRNLNALCYHVFDRRDEWTEVDPADAWTYAIGLVVFALLVMARRLRRLEVVA
jgi:ABC-type transport system involved in multi-copper enzyme maturation permease subunit